jgi:hypothetical protein
MVQVPFAAASSASADWAPTARKTTPRASWSESWETHSVPETV